MPELERDDGGSKWLRAEARAPVAGVDRQARVLRGYVVAQAGVFKDRRGAFDRTSLQMIADMMNASPSGLKSRLGHPTLSDDGIGKFLGRARDARMGHATDARTGKRVDAVRADLHLDPSASSTPHGDLAAYVMNLAESDPGAFSSSLVIEPEEVEQLDARGKPLLEDDGEPAPALWRPIRLHASDVVDTGDAVDSFLSPEELAQSLGVGLTPELRKLLRFDNAARFGAQVLDGLFRGKSRVYVEEHLAAWLSRYLDGRFGAKPAPEPRPRLDEYRTRLAARLAKLKTEVP